MRSLLGAACWKHGRAARVKADCPPRSLPCRFVFRIGMPAAVRIQLVRAMADIEHRLAYGTSDRLQLGALCGSFAGAWTQGRTASGSIVPLGVMRGGLLDALGAHLLPHGPRTACPVPAEAKEGIVKAAQ